MDSKSETISNFQNSNVQYLIVNPGHRPGFTGPKRPRLKKKWKTKPICKNRRQKAEDRRRKKKMQNKPKLLNVQLGLMLIYTMPYNNLCCLIPSQKQSQSCVAFGYTGTMNKANFMILLSQTRPIHHYIVRTKIL